MSSKQLFIFLSFVCFSFSTVLFAQETAEEYHEMKVQGLIPQIENTLPSTGPLIGIPVYPDPLSVVMGSGDDCLIEIDQNHEPVTFNDFGGTVVGNGCDDCSSDLIQLPFTYDICGDGYDSFFINSNGNVTFDAAFGTYTPVGIPNATTAVMIAPFWGDVDLRDCDDGTDQGVVTMLTEPNRVVVSWTDVGYFSQHCDKRNTFQLVLTDGTDPGIGIGNNTAFYFGDMQWTTGDASSGVNGFGGEPAVVGINANDGVTYSLIGTFDHAGDDYDGPEGVADGVDFLDDQCFEFAAADCNITFCTISNIVPDVVSCDGEMFDVEISFVNTDPNEGGYFIEIGDYVTDTLFYSFDDSLNSILLTEVPGDGLTYDILFVDVDETGCEFEVPILEPNTEFQDTVFCTGGTAILLEPTVPGGTWSGVGIDDTGTFDPATLDAGLYEVTYTLGDTDCPAFTTKEIEIVQTPDPSFESPSLCVNSAPVTLTPIDGGGIWAGDGVSTLTGEFDPSGLEPGEYQIIHAISNTDCPAQYIGTIEVLETFDASFDAPDFCYNGSVANLNPLTEGGTWSGEGVDPETGDFDPTGLEAGDYTISYSVGEGECAGSQEGIVKVLDELVIDTEGPICVDNSTLFTISLSVSGDPDLSYELSGFINQTVAGGEIVEAELEGDGSTEYELSVVEPDSGCSSVYTFTAPVCIECEPDAGVMSAGETAACDGETVDASVDEETINLEGDLVWEYVLHTSASTELGDVLGANNSGVFAYADLNDEAAYNTSYYISSLVGPDSGDGTPIYDSNCTRVAQGIEVAFLAPVEFQLNEYCDYITTGDYTLTVDVTGGLPDYDGSSYSIQGFYGDNDFGANETFTIVMPATDGTFVEFIATDDLGCTNSVSFEVICFKTPIELIRFTGETRNNTNILNWETASEHDNDFFTIEHSRDGLEFIAIGEQDAAGNSNELKTYSYTHTNPGMGTHYYRLAQTDNNGQKSYSNVIKLILDSVANIEVYPSPVSDVVLINTNELEESFNIRLYDLAGNLVIQEVFAQSTKNCSIDVEALNSGIYMLQLESQSHIYIQKVIKQ